MGGTKGTPRLTRKLRDMRIAIARDVIRQLRLGTIQAESGVYVSGTIRSDADISGLSDLSEVLPLVNKGCRVCALGACFLSRARLYDETAAHTMLYTYADGRRDLTPPTAIHERLAEIFGDEQVQLIELAFESYGGTPGYSSASLNAATLFGCKVRSDRARMRRIMQNIIDNDGVFCP